MSEAKKRREIKTDAGDKKNILWGFKWPLIKYVRSKRLGEKFDELEQQRLARSWCIKTLTSQVYAKIYKNFQKSVKEAKKTNE